jgi:hypothetical protein
MKLSTKLLVVVAVSAIAVSSLAVARGDFAEMVRRIPKDANVIVYIDVERLLATPLATKENWKTKQADDFANRPMSVPPAATKVVRAANINLDVDETAWQIAILEGKSIPALDTIAKKEKGYVDTVAGTQAVWSPRGAYAYKISNNSVGLMFPANRQFLARWIKEKPGDFSSYLMNASKDMTGAGPQIVIALELEDLVQPQRVREQAKAMESLKNAKVSAEDVAKTVIGIKGVKFAVTVRDKAAGKVTVDFATDATVLKDVGKPLLLEVLEHRGLALEDMDAWKATASKTSFVLEGDLSKSGLMRLSSLLELPSLPLDESAEAEVNVKDPKLYATQNHFKSVTALLNDLNVKRKEFTNPGHAAGWWDTYATRISRLPVANVDEEMQEYSAQIADLLREGAQEARGAGIRTGVQQANLATTATVGYGYSGNGYSYYGNRYSGARQQQAERNAIRARETGQAAMTGTEIRKQIQDLTEATRRKMTAKYKVEF